MRKGGLELSQRASLRHLRLFSFEYVDNLGGLPGTPYKSVQKILHRVSIGIPRQFQRHYSRYRSDSAMPLGQGRVPPVTFGACGSCRHKLTSDNVWHVGHHEGPMTATSPPSGESPRECAKRLRDEGRILRQESERLMTIGRQVALSAKRRTKVPTGPTEPSTQI